ncbi:MAG: 50S ribosomal protein L24 [Anaeromyxobacteraceae bacterium]
MPDIRKGDTVKVIAGREKGKQGRVLEVNREKGRVVVEKLMTLKRHLKKGRNPSQPDGGIIEKAGSIAISSVMVLQGTEAVRKEKIQRDLGAKEKAKLEKRKAAK